MASDLLGQQPPPTEKPLSTLSSSLNNVVHERRRQAFQRLDAMAAAEAGSVIARVRADFVLPLPARLLVEGHGVDGAAVGEAPAAA
jgi:hypothetical protein